MTEYAIGVSWAPSLGAALETRRRRDAGAEIRVVDSAGEPAAAGEVGDFQLRGPGLFLGYLRRPEANAASFIDGWFGPATRRR